LFFWKDKVKLICITLFLHLDKVFCRDTRKTDVQAVQIATSPHPLLGQSPGNRFANVTHFADADDCIKAISLDVLRQDTHNVDILGVLVLDKFICLCTRKADDGVTRFSPSAWTKSLRWGWTRSASTESSANNFVQALDVRVASTKSTSFAFAEQTTLSRRCSAVTKFLYFETFL
jgi:hypothetical protein